MLSTNYPPGGSAGLTPKMFVYNIVDRQGMVLALTELSDPDRFFREYSPSMYDLFTQSGGHIGVSGPEATRSWEVLHGEWPSSNKYVLINFMYTVDHAVKFLSSGNLISSYFSLLISHFSFLNSQFSFLVSRFSFLISSHLSTSSHLNKYGNFDKFLPKNFLERYSKFKNLLNYYNSRVLKRGSRNPKIPISKRVKSQKSQFQMW